MKKTINLLLVILMAAAFVFCAAACSSEEAAESVAPSKSASVATSAETTVAADVSEALSESAPEEHSESAEPEGEIELSVFAAASMTETLEEIATMYKDVAPNINLVFNFDSSGTLKTQIEEGAVCDLFISAAQKQMNELDPATDAGKESGLDFVEQGTRIDLLENKVALVVPAENTADITSFDGLAEMLEETDDILLAVGNSDVPVGQYTQKIFEFYGLNEEDLANEGLLSYGTNVKEVTTQVSEASVNAGIIYQTDAFSAALDIVDTATPEMCGQVIYPAAVMNKSEHKEAAEAFLDYLTTEPCIAVFESVGFSPVE